MVVRSKRSRKRSVTKSRRRTSNRRNSRNRKRVSKKKSRRSSKKKRRSRKRSSKKKRRSRRRYSNKNRKQKLKGGAAVGASNILQKLFSHIKKYDDINTDVQDEVRDAFAAKGKMEIIKKVMKKRMKRMKRLDFNDKVVEEKIIKDVTQFLVALVKLVISQNKTHIGGSELDGTVPQILPDESLVEVEEEGDWRDPNKTGMVSSEKQEMNLLSKYVRAVDFAVL